MKRDGMSTIGGIDVIWVEGNDLSSISWPRGMPTRQPKIRQRVIWGIIITFLETECIAAVRGSMIAAIRSAVRLFGGNVSFCRGAGEMKPLHHLRLR